jgi:UDP-glucose 4-epimerase
VRDYIHVVDLAKGHVKALSAMGGNPQVLVLNLGTGTGYSVLDLVKIFEQVSNKKIPYRVQSRRPGDIAECYADPTLAKDKIGWKAEKNLEEMCIDTWNFQLNNQID